VPPVSKRWLAILPLSGAVVCCSLVTDFEGVAEPQSGQATEGGSGAGGARFPRLAAYETSNPKAFDDPGHQRDAARLDVSIMGLYPGWEETHGPVEQVVKNVKALDPTTRLLVTISAESFRNSASGDAYQPVIDRLNAMSWWLYQNGGSGTIVPAAVTDQFATNTTLHAPKDESDKTFVEWFAGWSHRTWMVSAPSLDGILIDDLNVAPRVSGDFDRDGRADDRSDPVVGAWHRAGYRRMIDELARLMPNKLLLGDLGKLAELGAETAELEGVLHGGMLHELIGRSYSTETRSWSSMMSEYRRAFELVREPKLVIFHVSVALADRQTFRYAFASCLLDDGYFALTDLNGTGFGVEWFPEYEIELGAALSPPPDVPWRNGVWRRDFEQGVALVNPKGNGPLTLALEAGLELESLTLQDRDGAILRRRR
jgi:hypothetical protein